MYSVYSFADTSVVIGHPNIGQSLLSENGRGDITLVYAGEMSGHTATADGYTVVNKTRSHNGTVTLQVAQNSPADLFLRKYNNYVDLAPANQFALGTLTVDDKATGNVILCNGLTPQKKPDRAYAAQAGMISYSYLAAEIIDK